MSVRLFFRRTQTGGAGATPMDVLSTAPFHDPYVLQQAFTSGSEGAAAFGFSWQSERFSSESVTFSGSLSFRHYSTVTAGHGTITIRVSKVVSGGTDEQVLIGEASAAALPIDAGGAGALQTVTIPIATPVTVAKLEKLYVRFSVTTAPGETLGSGTLNLHFGGTSGFSPDTSLDIPDGATFYANTVGLTLYMRKSSLSGIGNFFDALPVVGPDTVGTGVVNTVAGGTEIQWTRTAGGTVLEWISPRFRFGWRVNTVDHQVHYPAFESNGTANCAGRIKAWRRRGTEDTLLVTYSDTSEFATSVAERTILGSTTIAMDFLADDRLVIRAYIIPVGGTMGSGRTCTIQYGSFTSLTRIFLNINTGEPLFKAESDPDEPPPSRMTLTGAGE